MNNKKPCVRCKEQKDLTDYYKNASAKDGLSTICKQCIVATAKEKSEKRNALYEYDPEKRISIWREKVKSFGFWAPMMQTSETMYE